MVLYLQKVKKEVIKMKSIKYYLPYCARNMFLLKQIQKRFGATYSINEKEIVTISATTEKKLEKIQKFIQKTLDK